MCCHACVFTMGMVVRVSMRPMIAQAMWGRGGPTRDFPPITACIVGPYADETRTCAGWLHLGFALMVMFCHLASHSQPHALIAMDMRQPTARKRRSGCRSIINAATLSQAGKHYWQPGNTLTVRPVRGLPVNAPDLWRVCVRGRSTGRARTARAGQNRYPIARPPRSTNTVHLPVHATSRNRA